MGLNILRNLTYEKVIIDRIRFGSLGHNRTVRLCTDNRKIDKGRDDTNINMETQKCGKTTAVQKLQNTLRETVTMMKHGGNTLLHFFFATRGGYNGGNDLSLSLSVSTRVIQPRYKKNYLFFALSHIYTYMTFRLFTHMSLPIGQTDRNQVLCHPVLPIFPSGGTCFPTNSPFTPAWDVAPVRSASGMLPACRVSVPWSACLTHSRPCES